jgi:hypothetical protein
MKTANEYLNGLSLAANGLRAVIEDWSKDNQTLGFVPFYVVFQILADDSISDELVAAGLWERSDAGFWLTGFDADDDTMDRIDAHVEKMETERKKPSAWQETKAKLMADRPECVGVEKDDEPEPVWEDVLGDAIKEELYAEYNKEPQRTIAADAMTREVELPDDTVVIAEPVKKPGRVPMRVQAEQKVQEKVAEKLPDHLVDGSDKNFDEFLDIYEVGPEDDRKCWFAWVEANQFVDVDDLLDATEAYTDKVPERDRPSPEEWLMKEMFIKYFVTK